MAWRALYPYAAAVRNRSLETTQVAIGLRFTNGRGLSPGWTRRSRGPSSMCDFRLETLRWPAVLAREMPG